MTALASGFTHTACFMFFPSHALNEKICIGGRKFKTYLTGDERLALTVALNDRGFKLSMVYVSPEQMKGQACPR